MSKEFQVIFKFSDVIQSVEAKSQEEAESIANCLLDSENDPVKDTYCYETEVEEITW